MQALTEEVVARLYLTGKSGEAAVLNIPGTKYQLHLHASGALSPTAQGRVRGVVRLPVWKLDEVTAGGAFIEPIAGRPRRVQGKVIATQVESNSVVVEVCGQPVVGELPPRWKAGEVAVGSRVGLDVQDGGVFEPLGVTRQSELGPAVRGEMVNLSVG